MTTPTVEELMDSIAAAYEALPRQLKSIARYFEQHRSSVMMDRVTDIAVACDVHPSAVVRFSKRFGFSGFSEMQAIFRRAYTERVAPIQSYQQRIRNLVTNTRTRLRGSEIAGEFIDGSRRGLEELGSALDGSAFDEALDLLLRAKAIYIAGVRRSFAAASYLAYALQHTRKRVILAPGLGGMYREQISSIRKGDALVAISFLPYGRETQYLRANGAPQQGEHAGHHGQPDVSARALRHRASHGEGRKRLWIPLADEYHVPLPGFVHRLGLQARAEHRAARERFHRSTMIARPAFSAIDFRSRKLLVSR